MRLPPVLLQEQVKNMIMIAKKSVFPDLTNFGLT